jgi:hypothetical protein
MALTSNDAVAWAEHQGKYRGSSLVKEKQVAKVLDDVIAAITGFLAKLASFQPPHAKKRVARS